MKPTTQLSFNHELTFMRPKRRTGRVFAALVVPLIMGGAAYALWAELTLNEPEAESATTTAAAVVTEAPTPVAAPEPAPVIKVSVDYVVRPKDTLGEIFSRLKIDVNEIPPILALPTVRDRFKPLQPGDKLTFMLENGALHRVDRRIGEDEVLSITRSGNGFAADVVTMPIEIRTAHLRGTINSAQFVAGRVVGLSREMIQQLENEIFGWDIDFARDLHPGDRYNVIYEQKVRADEYLGDGRIVAAEFVNDDKVYRAVRYASADGKIDGYFDPDGRSVHRQFLRAPLDLTRVSAGVDAEGRQLTLDTMAEHLGVDYPASKGTAVKAAADGKVRSLGVDGEYGNAAVIEHGGAISTLYAHLSAFERGLQAGQRVKQGDVIGYVGSTGSATAPHLHYEYLVNGTYTDPRAIEHPEPPPLPSEYRTDFQAKSDALLAALNQPGDAVVTAAITN